MPEERIEAVTDELRADGLVGGADDAPELTPAGRARTDQLVAARRDELADVVARYDPDRRPELDALLRRLSRELVGERP